jgi:hypothetical protein
LSSGLSPTSFAFNATAVRLVVDKALANKGVTIADVERAGGSVRPAAVEHGASQSAPPSAAAVRRILAELYPRTADARRIATDAGISTARIDFNGDAETTWFHVYTEAGRQDRRDALLAVAAGEYPMNRELRAFLGR